MYIDFTQKIIRQSQSRSTYIF